MCEVMVSRKLYCLYCLCLITTYLTMRPESQLLDRAPIIEIPNRSIPFLHSYPKKQTSKAAALYLCLPGTTPNRQMHANYKT